MMAEPQVIWLQVIDQRRFRKPLLYPLSYEGATSQGTCQRIPTTAQDGPPVPSTIGHRCSDRRSTHRARDPCPATSGAHRPTVPTAAQR